MSTLQEYYSIEELKLLINACQVAELSDSKLKKAIYDKDRRADPKTRQKILDYDNKRANDPFVKKMRADRARISRSTKEFKEKRRKYKKSLYYNNILYKMDHLLRTSINSQIKRNLFKKNKNVGNIYYLIGCSISSLKEYIERNFAAGMSWDNRGEYWHIDHIMPLSLATNSEELIMLSHYTNLRPLLAQENMSKSDRLPDSIPPNFPYWQHFLHHFEL